jgi:hypothetical protein
VSHGPPDPVVTHANSRKGTTSSARRKQGVKLDLLPYTKSKRNGGHRLDGTRVAGIGSCPARAGVDPASARGSSFPE